MTYRRQPQRLALLVVFLALLPFVGAFSLNRTVGAAPFACQYPLDHWVRHVIDGERPGRAVFVYVVEVDGDGRADVVTGGYWYRNPGVAAGAWPRQAIGAGFADAIGHADFDGDGRVDLLGTTGADNTLPFVWAHNAGDGRFTVYDNIDSNLAISAHTPLQGVAIARFQPDGPRQVALAWDDNVGGTQLLTVPADPFGTRWPRRQTSPISQGEALTSADIDHDGDSDLFLGSAWLRNDGPADAWTLRPILTPSSGAPDRHRLVDLDGDGDLDVVIGYGHDPQAKVAWYEQGDQPFAPWREHLIATLTTPSSSFPQSLDVGDIDGDGDLDVSAGQHRWYGNQTNLRAYVLENQDGRGGVWAEHLVYSGDEHHDGTQLLDVEGDGDLDIVSIGWLHNRVILYENHADDACAPPTPTPSATPTPANAQATSTPPSAPAADKELFLPTVKR